MKRNDSDVLRIVQSIEVELLDEFVRICDKHGLNYYLVYGSLLGAVRHSGFIPWDDDIDVAMLRSDYDKFRRICDIELKNDYYFQDYPKEPSFSDNNLHIRKKGTVYMTEQKDCYEYACYGVWLDIWPLDYIDNNEIMGGRVRYWLISKLNRIANARAYRNLRNLPLLNKVVHFLLLPISLNFIISIRERLCCLCDKKNEYVINFGANDSFDKEKTPFWFYGEPKLIKFGDSYYKAPAESEKLLSLFYGDYMKLPDKEEQRIYHRPTKILL